MPSAASRSDDSHLASALREFQAALEAGRPPDRAAFLERHAAVAADLRDCLDGLLLMRDLAAPANDAPVPGVPLGDFRLLREVGRGGMGVVYEAEQLSLGRRVALKVLPFAATLDSRRLQRFRTEAAAAAHLRHPHVVAVHGVGCERGVHYYAMQFVDGPSLSDVLRRLRAAGDADATVDAPAGATRAIRTTLPEVDTRDHFRTAARWAADAADALDHAHQYGVVHRDVKPGNLLLDADGTLYVADFGLAQVGGGGGLTRTGDILGTLRYMPPEQLRGERALDPRGDVYSLGATLYELLTLEPAFPALERPALLRQVLDEEPTPARRVSPAVPAELAVIAHKAMAKIPAERYASAKALADDLRAWLDDRPIRARPPSPAQHLTRWARRYRGVAVAAAAGLLLATATLAVSTVWVVTKNLEARAALKDRDAALQEARQRQVETDAALRDVMLAKAELAQSLEREVQGSYASAIALADRARRDGDRARADRLLADCPAARRGWEWHFVNNRRRNDALVTARERGVLTRLRFVGDGRSVGAVTASARNASSYLRWDIDGDGTAKPFRPLGGAGRDLAVSPDGRRIAAFDHGLLVESPGREVCVFDAIDGRELGRRAGPEAGIAAVTFAPDGQRVAVAGLDGTVSVWEPGADSLAWTAKSVGPALDVTFAADGKELAVLAVAADDSRTEVRFHDTGTGKLRLAAPGTARETFHEVARSLTYSPDGRHVVVPVGLTAAPLLLRSADGGEVKLPADACVRAFSPDGRLAVCLMPDGSAELVELATERAVQRLPLRLPRETKPGSWVLNRSRCPVAVSGDGQRVAFALDDGRVSVWSLASGREVASFPGGGKPSGVAFSPDGSKLAVSAIEYGVTVWSLTTAADYRELSPGGDGTVSRLAMRPDGRAVAALFAGNNQGMELRVWEPTTGKEILRRSAATLGEGWVRDRPGSLVFSPDGRQVAAGGFVNELLLGELKYWRRAVAWDLGGTIRRIRRESLSVDEIYCADEGDVCVTRYDSAGALTMVVIPRQAQRRHPSAAPREMPSAVRIYDADGKGPKWELPVPPAHSCAVSADAGRIALTFAAPAPALQVWDASTRSKRWELPPPLNGVSLAVALSCDGRRLVTRPSMKTGPADAPEWARRAVVWDVDTGVAICAFDSPTLPGAWGARIGSSFAFSPDGLRLATYRGVPGVKIWDATTGRELLTLGDDGMVVTEAAFTADGLLVTADETGAVRVWDGRATGR